MSPTATATQPDLTRILASVDELANAGDVGRLRVVRDELRAAVERAGGHRVDPGAPCPGALARWVTGGRELDAPHLDLIDQAFVDIAEGSVDRVALFMPPRRGKSRRAARWGALWYLRRFPHRRVAIVSYGAELAEEHSRWVRDQIVSHVGEEGSLDLGLRVKPGSKAANRFGIEGTDEGGLMAVGVGGPFTGRGADCIIIDDPVKNREEAESATIRKKTWEWYTDVVTTRLEPGGSIILIQTRWHESDLGGRVLSQADESWRIISIPEIAESDDDLLGRKRGDPLWPARFSLQDDERTRKGIGGRSWAALYQQRPAPIEGAVWKRTWFSRVRPDEVPPLGQVLVAIDPSATEDGSEDACGIVVGGRGLGRDADGTWILGDYTDNLSPAGWGRAACMALLRHDASGFVAEGNQGGAMIKLVLAVGWRQLQDEKVIPKGRALPGVSIVHARTNKRVRAEPVAALYEAGRRVWHVGDLAELEDEMLTWAGGTDSPNRMDAAVWLVTHLMRLGGVARLSRPTGSLRG